MYVIYGGQASLFTRKLEAAAIFTAYRSNLKTNAHSPTLPKLKAALAPIKYQYYRRLKTGCSPTPRRLLPCSMGVTRNGAFFRPARWAC